MIYYTLGFYESLKKCQLSFRFRGDNSRLLQEAPIIKIVTSFLFYPDHLVNPVKFALISKNNPSCCARKRADFLNTKF